MLREILAGLTLCPICRRDWPGPSGCCRRCRQLLESPIRKPGLLALGHYHGDLARAVRAFKFGGVRKLGPVFGEALAAAIIAVPPRRDLRQAVVSHVPLHPTRRRQRGYDQALLLAQTLASRLRLPLVATLERIRDTPQQARLRAQERRRNLAQAFRAVGPQIEAGVLLVDDVLTTGATLASCSEVLRLAGTPWISLVVVAVARHPGSGARWQWSESDGDPTGDSEQRSHQHLGISVPEQRLQRLRLKALVEEVG